MSDVVIDASAIIAVIADEPERKLILESTVASSLLSPASVHWEIGNAFSAMLAPKRQGGLMHSGGLSRELVSASFANGLNDTRHGAGVWLWPSFGRFFGGLLLFHVFSSSKHAKK